MRAATLSDLPRLYELLLEMQSKSKFAQYDVPVGVDAHAARSLLMSAVQRHGGTNNGSSFCSVIEHKGTVEGFIIGMLDRVYHIGDRLCANDIYLYCTDKAPAWAGVKLFRGYVAWALANPKVAVTFASHTDAIGSDGKIIDKLYEREGFRRCGSIWERVGQ